MIQVLFALLALLVAFIVYKAIILPYRKVLFYRRQGIEVSFVPLVGDLLAQARAVTKMGHFYGPWFERAFKTPRPKVIGTIFGTEPFIIFTDPELIKELVINHERFPKHEFFIRIFKLLMGQGLVLVEGKDWKKHRSIIATALHYEYLKGFVPKVDALADSFLDKLASDPKNLENMDIMSEMQRLTGDVVGILFFGEKFSDYKINGVHMSRFLTDILRRLATIAFSPPILLFGISFLKLGLLSEHRRILRDVEDYLNFCRIKVKSYAEEFLKNRQEGKKPTGQRNLTEILLECRYSGEEDALTDDEIVFEFSSFFLGGMDTTGHFVSMALVNLQLHPEYKERIMKEIDQHFGTDSKLTIENLNKMDFVTAYMKETLRLTGPAPLYFFRTCNKEETLGSYKIMKGTLLNVGLAVNQHDSENYDDPEKFDPTRFIESESKQKPINPYIFAPFSFGPRNCIGQHLAFNEGKIIFIRFLKKFDYEFRNKDYKLKLTQRFLLEPLELVRFDLKKKAK